MAGGAHRFRRVAVDQLVGQIEQAVRVLQLDLAGEVDGEAGVVEGIAVQDFACHFVALPKVALIVEVFRFADGVLLPTREVQRRKGGIPSGGERHCNNHWRRETNQNH